MSAPVGAAALEVLATGILALVQDEGRAGLAHLGVPPSGAADRSAYRAANRLVGNRAGAATVEVVLGGLEVRALGGVTIAVTGARCPLKIVRADGSVRGAGSWCLERLEAGDILRCGRADAGLRSYLAVRGGVDVPAVLGSRSRDVLSGLGPRPLGVGQLLAVGELAGEWPAAASIPAPLVAAGPVVLDARRGPRDGWFTASSLDALSAEVWTVSSELDRVGVRLRDGAPLDRSIERELPSEGVVTGAIQVPADGLPILFLRDHPVSGGYPVVAVLDDRSIDRAAQLVPGERVRLRLHA
ncbi:biotin-dependent carboxyltransferase family protein [Compostimonas suwonensis]|uniref:Biotin-dependent carboxylase-like uncharacterized protein n=1 Tax=Compostimonas suwonensis TaxID=1048394 RepID=A0A2M9BYL1_9MICO|nr:biotin-dependent carboxyltransferase family protein [Compostimonas suwonensis]PJJ63173.1 biotin-dependent carboxylase-like uncharacterized protein [Compostimonas suwonensis]